MFWIRNLERLQEGAPFSRIECELASESQVEAVLDYGEGAVLCAQLTQEPDRQGLFRYLLALRVAHLESPAEPKAATRRGYVFRGGVVGELIALLSLALESRFFLVSSASGELSRSGIKLRRDFPIEQRRCSADVDPVLFSGRRRSFREGPAELMDQVRRIEPQRHQELALAYHLYGLALGQVGIDDEMVFVRLVSAVEAVAGRTALPASTEIFACRDPDGFLRTERLSSEELEEVRRIFEVRKSKCKFITFVSRHSQGFFRGGRWKAAWTRIKRSDLPEVLAAIYDARSGYLHSGEPMYLSGRIRGEHGWHVDPSSGMVLGDRRYSKRQKLPYPYFFHQLVRHSLLQYTRTLAEAQNPEEPIAGD